MRRSRRIAVCLSYDEDGSVIVKAHLPPEMGAMVMKALEAVMRDCPSPDVSAETSSI